MMKNTAEEQAVIDAYHNHQKALVAQDFATVGTYLDTDYIAHHIDGRRATKVDSLADVESGRFVYHSFTDVGPISVTITGDIATLETDNDIDATINGYRHTWRLHMKNTYRQVNGWWLAMKMHASLA